jgi:hypothetical protein
MSAAVIPASRIALAAASIANPADDTSGTVPISVDSAAPTIAVAPGGIIVVPRLVRNKERWFLQSS